MQASGRKVAVVGVLCAAVVAGVGSYLRQFVRAVLVAGPMVQQVTPDGFSVVWRTVTGEPGRLIVADADKNVTVIDSVVDNGQHVARIRSLVPGRAYRYLVQWPRAVGSPKELARGATHTAKPPGEDIQFLVFGDSGDGGNTQYKLGEVMLDYEYDFALHTGDLVYSAGEAEDYPDKFYKPYAKLLRFVPFYPSLGNHDVKTDDGAPWLRAFVLPENGPDGVDPERFYWFDYGDARFVALDTTREQAELREKVAPWLARVLAEAETTWRFVYFHHPPYTNSEHDPDQAVREALVPVMEAGGVDVVFCGHNHLYERTKPIRAGKVVPEGEGIVYITTGAGGAGRYAEREQPADYIATYFEDAHSFTIVSLSGSTMRVRQIDIYGRIQDDWTYERPATSAQ